MYTRRNWIVPVIAAVVVLVLLALLLFFLVILPKISAPVAQQLPAQQSPAAVQQPPAALSIAAFNQMWTSTSVDNPGPLMESLNVWFDSGGYASGGQSSVGNWKVPAGTILWTDTLNEWFASADSTALRDGDIVRLRCQGNWCVYAIYREVICPTPGRYAILERWLNPVADLSNWAR